MLVFFGIIVLTLPVIIYSFNSRQDLQQEATTTINGPTLVPTIAGCPESNNDGTTNICRAQYNCEIGEIVKEDGANECSEKLQKTSVCCNVR